jgi:protocatechuate 3,4-dioxygenase beta subunit
MDISRRAAVTRIGAAGTIMLVAPGDALALLAVTPRATMGPFYPNAKPVEQDADLSLLRGRRALGELIEVTGRVLDDRGNPLPGTRVEIWQANAAGRYAHARDSNPAPLDPNFQGFGWLTTDRLGRYRFVSVKPGPYPAGGALPRPPHIHLAIQGSRDRLVTQMIFPGEPLNETDDVIASGDRARLTARQLGSRADGAQRLGWDIILG